MLNDLTIALSRLKTDFIMVAGDDKNLVFTLTEENGTATNIASAAIVFAAVKSGLRGETVLTKTTSSSSDISIAPGSDGIFTVSLQPADTSSLLGDYYYEVRVTFSGGNVAHPFKGVMTVGPFGGQVTSDYLQAEDGSILETEGSSPLTT